MAQKAQTFRIFVSSTFSDLKAERNALQERVFPRLRDLCQKHGARFQPIDLRWGVSDEASLDQQAMSICLGEVTRCQKTSPRPNFIVLLGDRYGWCPPPTYIPATEYEQLRQAIAAQSDLQFLNSWYSLDENAVPAEMRLNPRLRGEPYENYDQWQPVEARLHTILSAAAHQLSWTGKKLLPYTASATEQEIHAGALQVTPAPDHVLCFFRTINGFPRHFNAKAFISALKERLQQEYSPETLNLSTRGHINHILEMPQTTSAYDFSKQIKLAKEQIQKTDIEQGMLSLARQLLVDLTGADFLDMKENTWIADENAHKSQDLLKAHLAAYVPENIYTYQAKWTGSGITTDHIEQLCQDVYHSLSRIILAEVESSGEVMTAEKSPSVIPRDPFLDDEGLAHLHFAEERMRFFVGRKTILGEISNYLNQPDHHTMAIVGEGGTGKSALIAKAISQAYSKRPNQVLIFRFIGATASSSDGRSLLESLCREISRRYGADQKDIPLEYRELVPELGKRLLLATGQKPLVLFLDSLDQLSDSQGARSLSWLPNQLPDHVAVIVSTRGGEIETFENLKGKSVFEEVLEGLGIEEGRELLGLWLADVNRKLQDEQEQAVLGKFIESQCNPLYLKLAFEEARLWPSSQEPIEDLAVGISEIIKKNMINRLKNEGNHGEKMVTHTLGYLAASRFGLSEDEIVDLLSRDLEVYSWFFKKSHHLPSDLVRSAVNYRYAHHLFSTPNGIPLFSEEERTAFTWLNEIRYTPEKVNDFLEEALCQVDSPRLPIVLWSRLFFDLEPYLTERMVDGIPLLYFYHRELGEASRAVFLEGKMEQSFHKKLADYFRFKADPPTGEKNWDGHDRHGLSELPFHLTLSGQRDQIFKLLTDFQFLEHKAEEVGITRRRNEFDQEEISSEGVQDLQKDFELALNTFFGGGGMSASSAPLIRTAEESGEMLKVYCPVCNYKSEISREMLGQVITCPQAQCKTKLKLNTFTIRKD